MFWKCSGCLYNSVKIFNVIDCIFKMIKRNFVVMYKRNYNKGNYSYKFLSL